MAEDKEEPPFQGGSQPVEYHRSDVPGPGRTVGQTLAIALGALALLAGIVWVAVLFLR